MEIFEQSLAPDVYEEVRVCDALDVRTMVSHMFSVVAKENEPLDVGKAGRQGGRQGCEWV